MKGKKMHWAMTAMLAILVLSVMLGGCTTGPPESGTSTSVGTTATPPPFQPPGLTIHSRGNGSYVPEGNITVASRWITFRW